MLIITPGTPGTQGAPGTPDFAPSSRLWKASSGRPGGYVEQAGNALMAGV